MSQPCRSSGILTLAVCFACVALAVVIPAEAASARLQSDSKPRLLTADEGQSVLTVAWKHRKRARRKPDCSHLVHQVYNLAGFNYLYATSYHLFRGVENFKRVKKPQPGDLVVWKGHVGIVVDPGEQTFYSSVNSGLLVRSYDSRYWRGRGPMRFYRYVASAPPERLLAAGGAARPPAAGASRPALEIPSNIPVITAAARPTPAEVAEAVSELNNAAGEILRSADILKLTRPVVIFDQLDVKRVKAKGSRGRAQVQVESRVSIAGGKIKRKHRREKRRWELRRTDSGWVAHRPADRIYVPRAIAVRVLAEQIELLTRPDFSAPDGAKHEKQLAQLAGLLNALLEKK